MADKVKLRVTSQGWFWIHSYVRSGFLVTAAVGPMRDIRTAYTAAELAGFTQERARSHG